MYTQKWSLTTFKRHNGSWSQYIGPEKQILGKEIRPNFFAFDKFTLQNLANKSGGVETNLLYTFYTSHLRWNSTTRSCLYHTDLGQNAVFHYFAIQIAVIKYSGPWKHVWAFSENVKKISKITHTATRFSTILTSAKWMNSYRVTLQQSKEFIMFIMFIIIFFYLMVL